MIANPKWFNLRKYTGWGLTPNCYQGWLYILAYILPVIVISFLPLSPFIKNNLSALIMIILVADVVHIMTKIKTDERERLHEAIADRNALWIIMTVLVVGCFIKQAVDPVVIIAVLAATLIRAITQFYLRDK